MTVEAHGELLAIVIASDEGRHLRAERITYLVPLILDGLIDVGPSGVAIPTHRGYVEIGLRFMAPLSPIPECHCLCHCVECLGGEERR